MDRLRKYRTWVVALVALLGVAILLCMAPMSSLATDAGASASVAGVDSSSTTTTGTDASGEGSDAAATGGDATTGGAEDSGSTTGSSEASGTDTPSSGGEQTDAGQGAAAGAGTSTTEPAADTGTPVAEAGSETTTEATTEVAPSLTAASSAADSPQDTLLATTATGDVKILYEEGDAGAEGGGLHYVYSVPDDPTSQILYLYCMNNSAHWPHTTPGIGDVPDYTLGYLTPDMFSSEAQYEECMAKLKAILYAGYPYNGMGYYTLVADEDAQSITEDEFNAMLETPANIAADFPDTAGSTTFTMSDYTDSEKIDIINQFMKEVGEYFPVSGKPTKTTPSGLTYTQIVNSTYYKALYSMLYASWNPGTTPLQAWDAMYASNTTLLTRAQAYNQTQHAIWVVLHDYGVPENTLTSDYINSEPLAKKLYEEASASAVLDSEPSDADVTITGDAQFSYDSATGTWRTGTLTLTGPTNYYGTYALNLPDGVSAQTDKEANLTTLTSGTSFYLSTTTKPTAAITVSATATMTWFEEVRQYSPTATASDGKNFQHMIGALIHQKAVTASLSAQPATEGDLTVSKTVAGETGSTASFAFTVTLGDTSITGTYGDMTFDAGVASFSLQDGESATASNLPPGTTYTVTETLTDDQGKLYSPMIADANGVITQGGTVTGAIEANGTALAAYTNMRGYGLAIGKLVSGDAASTTEAFPLQITLTNADGTPVNGDVSYVGGVADGVTGVTAPADGTLTFTDGRATISLSHGQVIVLEGIAAGTTYAVTEVGAASATDATGAQQVTYTDADGRTFDVTTIDTGGGTLAGNETVTVTNALETGSLSILKHVEGEVGSTTKFTFTITLGGAGAGLTHTFSATTTSASDAAGTATDVAFTNGTASVALTAGQTLTVTGLPAGATYKVTEGENSKYTATSSNADGTIAKDETAQVTFTNTRVPTALPLSGEDGIRLTYVFGASALLTALALIVAHRVRARRMGGDDGE